MLKTPAELEAALLEQGVASTLVKMIVVMTTSGNIERLGNNFLIPVGDVLDIPIRSNRDRQKFQAALPAMLRAVIDAKVRSQERGAPTLFPVVRSIQQARDSQVLQYSFSDDFMRWAGLSSAPAPSVH